VNGATVNIDKKSFRLVLVLTFVVVLGSSVLVRADAFTHPSYVAADSAGNIYVTEPERHRVQKFDATGVFITQWGTFGVGDGQFETPFGIAIDSANNVYVADYRNSRIQKFTDTGQFVTKWAVGYPLTPNPRRPVAVAVDTSGNVYVTMTTAPRVHVFSGAGVSLRAWGDTGTGDGEFSQSVEPRGIAVGPAGFVYVSDTANHRVQRFNNAGLFIGWAGRCSSGSNCDVANQRNNGFFSCSAATCSVTTASGNIDGQFLLPAGITVGAGIIYVVDSSNRRIQFYDLTGFKRTFGSGGIAVGQLSTPTGAALDTVRSEVVIADTGNNRLQRFDALGNVTRVWGPDVRMTSSRGEAPGIINPIAIDPSSTTQSTITIESVNQFGGPVNLTVQCCGNYVTGVGPAPIGVTATLSNSSVTVPVNGSAPTLLNIGTTSAPSPGKFIAFVNASNAALGINRQVSVVFTVNGVPGADFSLANNPPAGTAPFPDLIPPKSATYTLYVSSASRLAGEVSLSASCCFDVITQKTVPVPGIGVSLSTDRVSLTGIGTPPGGVETQTATITVTTSGAPFWGKLLVPVTATSQGYGITKTTNVEFSEFPTSDPPPICRPGTEVLPVSPLIRMLVTVKEQDPTKAIIIGIKPVRNLNVIQWKIEEDSTLTASQATIILDNKTGNEKEITTAGCSSAPQTIRVSGGQMATMTLTTADTAIVLRRPFCTFLCLGHFWGDAGVFSGPALWRIIGGRKNTFTWLQD
jgi:hypothetical protein